MAKETAGMWTSIISSPMQRALETARRIQRTNPQIGSIEVSALLSPWALGAFEGKPSDEARPKINKLILSEPRRPAPGISKESKLPGRSFADTANDIIKAVQMEIGAWEPGQKRLIITHGRQIKCVEAWLKSGSPWNRQFSRVIVTRPEKDPPAHLFQVTSKGLKPVSRPTDTGCFLLRHGATDYSMDCGGKVAGSS